MSKEVRVLLCGDVNGKFGALFNRVAAVNKSSGPFDLLLCAGHFFPQSVHSAEEEEALLAEIDKYVTGTKAVPVPTYFASSGGSESLLAKVEDPDSKADIHCLGSSALRDIAGLSIAFLAPGAEETDRKALEADISKAEEDVDILLTRGWPAKISLLCAPGSVPEGADSFGLEEMAALALKVRPRYHIAAGTDVFFARVPYINKDLGAGAHVTRFLGLASVGNAAKQRSLHALKLQPASGMDAATLQSKPAGSTPCPYTISKKRPAEEGMEGQAWRWGENNKKRRGADPSYGRPGIIKDDRKTIYVKNIPFAATEDDIVSFFSACGAVVDFHRGMTDGKLHGWGLVQFETVEAAERACQLPEANLMGRDLFIDAASRRSDALPSGAPVQGCWFCLSSSTADLGLVVSVGENMYVALDKGPINGQHALLLPIEHRPNSLELSPSAYSELERYLSALRTCFASKGKELLAFERYLTMKSRGGNHMQFNVLAIPAAAAKRARQVAMAAAERLGITLKPLDSSEKGEAARAALRDAVGTGEFFHMLLPDGSRLVHAVAKSERHPVTFGREVAAELAGAPQRADWRECKVDDAEGRSITDAFKELFKPYDIMG